MEDWKKSEGTFNLVCDPQRASGMMQNTWGIKPNTIRLSIGTENIDDIIQDLDEAFKAVQ